VLSGQNTYTGETDIWSGTLKLGISSGRSLFGGNYSALGRTTDLYINGGTLDLNGHSQTVGNVYVEYRGGYIINSAGSATLTAINSYDFDNGAALTISANLAGGASLTQEGNGTTILSGHNTYTGGTTISAGTIRLGSDTSQTGGTINYGPLGKAGVTITGGTLDLYGHDLYNPVTLNGDFVNVTNLTNTSSTGAAVYGGVVLATGSLNEISAAAGSTLIVASAISGSDPGALLVIGDNSNTGTVILSQANTYAGGTALTGGVLSLGNSAALAGTSSIVFDGGTLQYSSANQTDFSSLFTATAGR